MFAQPVLLGGLLLIGLPVLIHMIMRQQPKRLRFPAMRFLVQRHRSNQRKMQLRHLFLLGLRMLLIALACLALTRPRVHNERLNFRGDQARAVVLVVDTSPSMEYKVAGKTRLDEARRLGLELMDELPPGSKVAVLDTASPGGDWEALTSARGRLASLQPSAANYPVTSQLAHAYDLFARLKQDQAETRKNLVPFLFVFSDRTEASWDRNQIETLKRLRDRAGEAVNAAYVDVGVDQPEDLALTDLRLKKPFVTPEEPVRGSVTVRATGHDADIAVVFKVDDDVVARKPVPKLDAGQARTVGFEHLVQTPGPHHVKAELEVADASLTFNDQCFATFEVRGGRRVLTLTDDPKKVSDWNRAVDAWGFTSEVKSLAEVEGWTPREDFARYSAVCLVHVTPEGAALRNLWARLDEYVLKQGGGLLVVPGGMGMSTPEGRAGYNDKAAQNLMPGELKAAVVAGERGTTLDWDRVRYAHPMLSRWRGWFEDRRRLRDFLDPEVGPRALRYWPVVPYPDQSSVLISYEHDDHKWPLLLERQFPAKDKIRGRVLLLTNPMDDRHNGNVKFDAAGRWNNFLAVPPSFYAFLVHEMLTYLAGDDRQESLTFQCGQLVSVPVPSSPRFPTYTIQGPGLAGGADSTVPRVEGEYEIRVPQATQRGSFTVLGPELQRMAGFSLNDAPEESQLLPRVPNDQIEALLGPDCVLELNIGTSLREALEQRWSQPVELFPLLMILLLLALAVENLLANKFYRQPSQEELGSVKVPEEAKLEKKKEAVSAS